ncbi:hypothetical protein ACG2F4_09785 [Halalkalibaculum sp. DA3122]|uniref:hypothetical protein n=1 Tax=unclassified Halalkalibaculum TaxID=2964617 RepID=UPI003755345B
MTYQEITDGNSLIENFMDSTIKIEQEDVKDIPLAFLATEDLKFHISWKWLMPVVIKIEEDLGHTVHIAGNRCQVVVDDDTIFEAEADKKLEAVWKAIVDFLDAQ